MRVGKLEVNESSVLSVLVMLPWALKVREKREMRRVGVEGGRERDCEMAE